MPKIVALADTHGQHWEIEVPKGDILVCCGDITRSGTMLDVIDFNTWLSTLSHKTKIVIGGNHDYFLTKGKHQSQVLLDEATYLENELFVTPQGLTVWGSPITPRFLGWYFMADENEINKYWAMIPSDGIDILVTHGPVYGILDELPIKGHLGCKHLANRVKRIQPKLHVCGHIHNGYGVTKIEETIFTNASICDEMYNPVNKPIVIDF